MKKKLVMMAVGCSFVLNSCGDKKAGASGEGGEAAAVEDVKKVDTPESLSNEVMAEFNHLLAALKTVKDKESAEAAVAKIDKVGDSMVAISKRAMEIEKPTEEERKALDAKMEKKMEGFQNDMGDVMKNLMTQPEAMKIVGGALTNFGKKMSEADEGFKRLGKDSNE